MGRYYPMDSDTAVVLQDKEIAMNRYIDAEYIIRKYINTDIEKFNNFDVRIVLENLKQNILKAPSIDIVRCSECKYWSGYKSTMHNNHPCSRMAEEHNLDYWTKANDFCSYGERSK